MNNLHDILGARPVDPETGSGPVFSEIGPKSVRFSNLRCRLVTKRHKLYQNFTKTLPNLTNFSFFTPDDPGEPQRGPTNGALGQPSLPPRVPKGTKSYLNLNFADWQELVEAEIQVSPKDRV
jgi:hypothetical protein